MNLEEQTVVVKGDVAYDVVLEKIKKTGKEVGCVVGGSYVSLNWLYDRCGLARWCKIL